VKGGGVPFAVDSLPVDGEFLGRRSAGGLSLPQILKFRRNIFVFMKFTKQETPGGAEFFLLKHRTLIYFWSNIVMNPVDTEE
jgi:hypothetical protein